MARDVGNIVGSIIDRRKRIAIRLEWPAAEGFQRQPALPVDEIECAFAFDVLEPEIRIIIGVRYGGPVVEGHGSSSGKAYGMCRHSRP